MIKIGKTYTQKSYSMNGVVLSIRRAKVLDIYTTDLGYDIAVVKYEDGGVAEIVAETLSEDSPSNTK